MGAERQMKSTNLGSKKAITRKISDHFNQCLLTYLHREDINLALARAQHLAYEEALRQAGCLVESLPELADSPDAVFVEDTAIVLDEVAVLARPGAPSRRAEVSSIARCLSAYRPLQRIKAPGILDGGDVLRLGQRLFVGISSRTNASGIEQLRSILSPWNYQVTGISLDACLHLKTAITQVAENIVLLNPDWIDPTSLGNVEVIEVDSHEPFAANGLLIQGSLIYPEAFPKTRKLLEERGISILPVDISEFAKAEAGVTCCSLVFEASYPW